MRLEQQVPAVELAAAHPAGDPDLPGLRLGRLCVNALDAQALCERERFVERLAMVTDEHPGVAAQLRVGRPLERDLASLDLERVACCRHLEVLLVESRDAGGRWRGGRGR